MLQLEISGAIARVILDRPDVHNAFNDDLIRRLGEAFSHLAIRNDVRVIVLRANGKSFSAGGDLKWIERAAFYTPEENVRDAKAMSTAFVTLARCPKPVIARIHGAAIGGGSGLAAACDIAIAVESAQFGFPEAKLGIIPAIISPFVISRIGAANAREYFLTGERFPAMTAKAMGLVQHVVRNETELDEMIASKIKEILTASPEAIAAAKELIFGVAGRPLESTLDFTAESFARARASREGKAGIAAFLSRTKPPWIPQ
jgi:methylglutaconyl-CoA hydratase